MTDQTIETAASTDSDEVQAGGPDEPHNSGVADEEPVVEAPAESKLPRPRRSISLSVRSLLVGAVIVILIGAAGTFAWLYVDAHRQLDAQASQSSENARAEKISLDYAVDAATMDFKDLQPWKVKLVAGTNEDLNKKLSDAAVSMEQVLVPLEWKSTAQPLVAKVRSRTGGLFVVDCFVSVQTKTVQAPDALQSTATYSITIDSNNNWLITDVGGIGSVVEPK